MAKYNKKAEKNNLEELSAGKFACAEEYIASKNSCVNIYEICPISTRDRYRTALEKVAGGWVNEDGEGVVCKLPKNAVAENLTKKQLETDEYAEFDKASFIRCKDNFYPEAISSNNPEYIAKCTACPAGKKAKNASSIQDCVLECPSGSFCYVEKQKVCKIPVAEGETCQAYVLEDKLSENGEISVKTNVCPAGYVCKENTNVEIYQDNLNDDDSINVESLYNQLSQCPIGFYCPEGTVNPVACDEFEKTDEGKGKGFYCPIKSEKPMLCPAGYYCPKDKRSLNGGGRQSCSDGYYCPEGSLEQIKCSKGNYCKGEQGTGAGPVAETPCPSGKFCGKEGMSEPEECKENGVNYYCPSVTERKPCPNGYHCVSGGQFKNGVGVGQYSAAGAIEKCKAGYYFDAGSNDCLACPKGFYCEENASGEKGTIKRECPANSYCDTVALSSYKSCSANAYCPVRTENPIYKKAVVIGAFESYTKGLRYKIKKCKPGYFIDETGEKEDECSLCGSGYSCSSGSDKTSCSVDNQTGACSRDEGGAIAGLSPYYQGNRDCAKGYINGNIQEPNGSTYIGCVYDCEKRSDSDRAYVCDPTDGVDKGRCNEADFYSRKGEQCVFSCPRGYVCENNKISKETCASGYVYASDIAAFKKDFLDSWPSKVDSSNVRNVCKACPTGYKCRGSKIVKDECSAGYYKPEEKTGENTECISENDASVSAGYYIEDGKKVLCPAGYYCPGAGGKKACPAGTYRAESGAKSENECAACPAGTYSSTIGTTSSTSCRSCPDYKWSNAGTKSVSGCGDIRIKITRVSWAEGKSCYNPTYKWVSPKDGNIKCNSIENSSGGYCGSACGHIASPGKEINLSSCLELPCVIFGDQTDSGYSREIRINADGKISHKGWGHPYTWVDSSEVMARWD